AGRRAQQILGRRVPKALTGGQVDRVNAPGFLIEITAYRDIGNIAIDRAAPDTAHSATRTCAVAPEGGTLSIGIKGMQLTRCLWDDNDFLARAGGGQDGGGGEIDVRTNVGRTVRIGVGIGTTTARPNIDCELVYPLHFAGIHIEGDDGVGGFG